MLAVGDAVALLVSPRLAPPATPAPPSHWSARPETGGDLWVPKMSCTSRNQATFVNEATEAIGFPNV